MLSKNETPAFDTIKEVALLKVLKSMYNMTSCYPFQNVIKTRLVTLGYANVSSMPLVIKQKERNLRMDCNAYVPEAGMTFSLLS